jgi:ribokinase
MTEVFVLGSINQDFVLKVERRPEPGETVTGAELSTGSGGKGANQASAAAMLGASVSFLGRVGDDEFGEPLVRALEAKGIDTSLIKRLPGRQTGAAFITVTPDGENAITVAPGANRAITPEDVDAASGAIRGARVLVAQMEVPKEVVGRAAEVAASGDTRILLNLAPTFEVPRELLERLDPLVVNEHEATFLLGSRVEGVNGDLSGAPELLTMGPSSAVITLGGAGAVIAGSSPATHIPAPEVEVVDTTGAGDAFVGALAVKLARDASLEEAASYAVRAGAAAVTKEGAQGALPTPEVVETI